MKKNVEFWVCYKETEGVKFIQKDEDGQLTIFDNEHDAKRFALRYHMDYRKMCYTEEIND